MIKHIAKSLYYKYLRNKQKINTLKQLDKPTFIHIHAVFKFNQNIKIGRYCRIGKFCNLDGEGGLEIGDGTILAPYVSLLSSSHNHNQMAMLPYDISDKVSSINIGRGCWLGWGAMVAPGVTIGDGAVVGMGAVVTKDVDIGGIVVGNPAQTIKKRDAAFVRDAIDNKEFYLKLLFENKITRQGRVARESRNFWIKK